MAHFFVYDDSIVLALLDYSFSIELPCQKTMDYVCVNLFLDSLFSSTEPCVSIFTPIQ